MAINRVLVAGNLTRDAELRNMDDGFSVLNFSMAVNEKRKDRESGEYVDAPVFVRCAVFGQRAAKLRPHMTKGTKVMVDGRLRYSTYMKDDEKRSDLSIVVEQLEFGGGRPRQDGNMDSSPSAEHRGQGALPPDDPWSRGVGK